MRLTAGNGLIDTVAIVKYSDCLEIQYLIIFITPFKVPSDFTDHYQCLT